MIGRLPRSTRTDQRCPFTTLFRSFPDPASWLVDQERRAAFLEEGEHYESRYHLALTWLPTADSAEAAGRSLVDRPDAEKGRDWRGALASFLADSHRTPEGVVEERSVAVRVSTGRDR